MNQRKLKLLIVDDESNIRDLLCTMIDWPSLGIEVVGEAATGAEALDLMEELFPDIVLVDIEMPYMDGLALSDQILKRYHDVTIVILTAHDHFQYAQRALQSGVSNYLLKPIEKESFERTMHETAKQIWARRERFNRMEISYKLMQDNRVDFRDHFLREIMHTSLGAGQKNIEEMLGLHLVEDCYTLALLNIINNHDITAFAAQKYFMLNNIRIYIEEHYAAEGQLYAFWDTQDNLALLAIGGDVDLLDICRRLTAIIGDGMDCHVCSGVSHPMSKSDQLPIAYVQASEALRLSYVAETNNEDKKDFSADEDLNYQEKRISDLLLFIKSGVYEKALQLTNELLARTAESAGRLNAAKMCAIQILAGATTTLAEQGIPWLSLISQTTPFYADLLSKGNVNELKEVLAKPIEELCRMAEGYQRRQSSETVSKMIWDLEKNYGDSDLSLATMARKYALNANYLSRAFKGYTGHTFSEYLTELRIQKAREILDKSDCKAHQVAQVVGIPDPNYFTKCFKKVTGISFQEYKQSRNPRRKMNHT